MRAAARRVAQKHRQQPRRKGEGGGGGDDGVCWKCVSIAHLAREHPATQTHTTHSCQLANMPIYKGDTPRVVYI